MFQAPYRTKVPVVFGCVINGNVQLLINFCLGVKSNWRPSLNVRVCCSDIHNLTTPDASVELVPAMRLVLERCHPCPVAF
jgi:hypothetical protein